MASDDPKVLLNKLEGAYGVDAVPTPAANAILIKDEIRAPQIELFYADRNNAKAFFGRDQQLVVGKKINVGFDVEIAGSGVAGTAPKYDSLLRSCALGAKTLAAAHAGVATAGGVATITLAAGASAVDAAYQYLRIRITSGTGTGQVRWTKSYVGATKVATVFENWTTPPDATSNYSIDAQVGYYPVSSGIESSTTYFYFLGFVHKLLGSRGNAQRAYPNMDIPRFSIDLEGLYGGIADDVYPAAVLSGFQTPLGVNNQNTSLVNVHGYAAKLYDFSFNLANQIVYRNLPGVEDVQVNDRDPAGSVEFEAPTIASKDFPAVLTAGSLAGVSFTHGTAAGNIVDEYIANAQLTNPRYGSRDKVGTWQMDLIAKPSDLGNDESILTVR